MLSRVVKRILLIYSFVFFVYKLPYCVSVFIVKNPDTSDFPDYCNQFISNALKKRGKNDVDATSDEVRDIIQDNYPTLFQNRSYEKNRLTYEFNKEIGWTFITNAEYHETKPEFKVLLAQEPDFCVLCGTLFGLRAYLFNQNGEIIKEWGENNTTFYSVADNGKNLLALANTSCEKICLVDRVTLNETQVILGFSATAMQFCDNKLYFVASRSGNNKYDVYSYDCYNKLVEKLTEEKFSDARGLFVTSDYFLISEPERIVVWNRNFQQNGKVGEIPHVNFPNNISATKKGTFLIADEHNFVVRECRISFWPNIKATEIRATPFSLLASPGSAIEIDRGKHKGRWLICDTDHDRIILVDPSDNYKVIFEIRNLRSVISAVPVYDFK